MKVALAALALVTAPLAAQHGPNADIWLDHGGIARPGDVLAVHYVADAGSYISIVRFDADGWMTILSPNTPSTRAQSSASTERIITFTADANPGTGTLFLVASRVPLNFQRYMSQDGTWLPGTRSNRLNESDVMNNFVREVTGSGNLYTLSSVAYQVSNGTGVAQGQPIYGYGYDYGTYDPLYDPWYTESYGRSYRDYRYGSGYGIYGYRRTTPVDPRTPYYRHCADGTLVPLTVPCGSSSHPRPGAPPYHSPAHIRPPTPPRLFPTHPSSPPPPASHSASSPPTPTPRFTPQPPPHSAPPSSPPHVAPPPNRPAPPPPPPRPTQSAPPPPPPSLPSPQKSNRP